MSWTNFHTHSYLCDGVKTFRDYVESAVEKKMYALGFSGHSPVPFESEWNMTASGFVTYLSEIKKLQYEYSKQLPVYLGLEIDYINNLTGVRDFEEYNLDYTISGVHYLKQLPDGKYWEIDNSPEMFRRGLNEIFDGNIQKLIYYYFDQIMEMVEKQPPNIIAHLDLVKKFNKGNRFFPEDSAWYRQKVEEVLQVIAKSDCIVEVNTRSYFKKLNETFSPGDWILKRCLELKIPVTLSADAHAPQEVTSYLPEAAHKLRYIGFETIRVLKNNQWIDLPFDKNGIKKYRNREIS